MFWYISHVISMPHSLTPVWDRLNIFLYILKCLEWRHQKMILWSHQFFSTASIAFFIQSNWLLVFTFWWWRDFINYADKKNIFMTLLFKNQFFVIFEGLFVDFCCLFLIQYAIFMWMKYFFVLNNWWKIFLWVFIFNSIEILKLKWFCCNTFFVSKLTTLKNILSIFFKI